jgi:hypothetical protein
VVVSVEIRAIRNYPLSPGNRVIVTLFNSSGFLTDSHFASGIFHTRYRYRATKRVQARVITIAILFQNDGFVRDCPAIGFRPL